MILDRRFEQLRQAAGDTLFSDLQSKADIEVRSLGTAFLIRKLSFF
jgi:hypothetical protein